MSLKADIFQNNNFSPFITSISKVIQEGIEKFWEQDVKIKLRAINNFRELREEKLVLGTDFFSSQIKIENHKPVIIRLDNNFVENFFEIVLEDNITDTRSGNYKLSGMSKLEVKILNNFCEFLYKKIKDILIPVNTVKLSEKSEKNINFLFYVATKNSINSNLLVTIPLDRIDLKEFKHVNSFVDEDFISQSIFVKVKMGTSKITLSELKTLEAGDIVVLEESDAKSAILISGDFEKSFKIKPNLSLILDIENKESENIDDKTNNEVIMDKNLWDDIQVEINAEFTKVKMSIGELKQITQGQIIDLGSIFENEISLFVEDKKVAKGELIIINDKYAVRLSEVISSNVEHKQQVKPKPQPQPQAKAQAHPQVKTEAKPKAQPQAKAQAQGQDEEFDYSDFEK